MSESGQAPESSRKRATPKDLESRTFKDGAIYLYRRADYKKPTWFIRLKIPGAKGYVWKSSGSTDEHAAYSVAEDLYNQSLVKVLSGAKLTSKRVPDALRAYIQHLETQHDRPWARYRILLAKRLIPLFQGRSLDEIDTALIAKMGDELNSQSKRSSLSPNTIRRIHVDFRHFLNWCRDLGHISALPRFPKVPNDRTRRPHFDARDWKKLTRFLREHIKQSHPSVLRDRTMLVNYVLILANTGIRVGEARGLKWRDLRPIKSGDSAQPDHLALYVKGKTGVREVVARTSDVKRYFERVLELRRKDLTNEASDLHGMKEVPLDSYVFCGTDGKPVGSFKKSFSSLVKSAGVELDSHGQRRTIYSLRHTYATFRLQEGVNQFILARNMGTSVAMLEDFYGHNTTIASTAELTKSRGTNANHTSSTPSKPFDWLSM